MHAVSILALLVPAALSGCQLHKVVEIPSLPEPSVTVSGQELVFIGHTTRKSPARVRELLASSAISSININSPGGDVEGAPEIASLVRDHQLDVRVHGSCLSSCANYIFPSGRKKFIMRGAIVAWHGNVAHMHYQDTHGQGSSDEIVRKHNATLAAKETEFMRTIGVDPYVAWFAKLPPFNVPDFYALTVADMGSFGIKGVTAPWNYGPAYLDSLPPELRNIVVFISADAEPARHLPAAGSR